MDLICALLMPAIRVIDTYSASHKGSLREPAHTGILQDARGTPSSQRCRFAANGAWLAVQVMAHNLHRWTARLGLGEQIVTTKTLRRRFFSLGRTAYPLGAPTHFASSPALALGKPVQPRPGTAASPSTPSLTATLVSTPTEI